MDLKEKAAYIKGLADGLELDTDRKEARVIREMLDLLAEMAGDVDDIGADLTELYEVVEEIDEDLSYIEDEVLGGDGQEYGDELYEIVCPNCQESVRLDEEMLMSGNVICPGCGEKIEIEIDSSDGDEPEHD